MFLLQIKIKTTDFYTDHYASAQSYKTREKSLKIIN